MKRFPSLSPLPRTPIDVRKKTKGTTETEDHAKTKGTTDIISDEGIVDLTHLLESAGLVLTDEIFFF